MFELSSYEIIKKLATGGMAEIYLARHRSTEGFQRNLVLKRILPEYSEDATFVQSFLDEARLAGQLSHPNIVQIYDLGKVGKAYFIAMEYIRGYDLHSLLRLNKKQKTYLPLGVALRIFADMCAGLDYAHHAVDVEGRPLGVVHRDVTPSNVLVSMEGHSKVVDFGIAKATALGENKTKTGTIKGKFAYLAPEQVMGQPIDRRVDIWAAGIVLYELLVQRNPFKGDTEYHTLQNIVTGELRSVTELRPEIPAAFEAIVNKALSRNVATRYSTAAELMHDVETTATKHTINLGYGEVSNYLRSYEAALQSQRDNDVESDVVGSQSDIVPGSRFSANNTEVDVVRPAPPPDAPAENVHVGNGVAAENDRTKVASTEALAAGRAAFPQTKMNAELPSVGADSGSGSRQKTGLIAAVLLLLVAGGAGTWFALRPQPLDQVPSAMTFEPVPPVAVEPSAPVPVAPSAPSAPEPSAPVVVPQPSAPAPVLNTKNSKGKKNGKGRTPAPVVPVVATPTATPPAGKDPVPAVVVGTGPGKLRVVVKPWATVEIDGRVIGDTPFPAQTLTPGAHTVVLTNSESNKRVERKVTIEPGKELVLRESLE